MRKTLFFCMAVLLSVCGCAGEAISSVTPAQSLPAAPIDTPLPASVENLDGASLAEPVLDELIWKDIGSGEFADAGGLSAEQQTVILQYMDHYYDSLAALGLRAPDELFAEDAGIQLSVNKAVWEYLIGIRAIQKTDLTLTSYQYDLTCQSMEDDEANDRVTVRVSEHSIQNFTAYPGVDTEAFNVIHSFVLAKQPGGGWLIESHVQMDSTFWLVAGRYAFRRSGTPEASQQEILDYLENRKQELLNVAKAELEARADGDPVPVPCDEAYDRDAAAAYAIEWVGRRSDDWPDYSRNGGNCQNFTSQCLLEGGIPMDIQNPGVWKWYGSTPDSSSRMAGRSASWSAVEDFLVYVQNNQGYGLAATADVPYYSGEVGDILHLGSEQDDWRHTIIITDVLTDGSGRTQDYLICSNTADLKNFPASAYPYAVQMLIKIHGWNHT